MELTHLLSLSKTCAYRLQVRESVEARVCVGHTVQVPRVVT